MEFGHDRGEGSTLDAQGDYPLLTPVTSELLLHVEALQTLFAGEQPMMIPIHPTDRGKHCFFWVTSHARALGGQPNTPMAHSPHERGCGTFNLLKEDPISVKLKIRSIIFSLRSGVESMTGVNYGLQLIILFGHLHGTKECKRPGICSIWFSP